MTEKVQGKVKESKTEIRSPADTTNDNPGSIWTKDFILLCFANLSFFVSSQAFLPTLPLYLLKVGGGQRDVGYVMGIYTLAAMIMRAIAGLLSDRYGRKKIMMSGLVLMLAVSLCYRFGNDVTFVAILRLFHGLGFGLVATAISTMVADSLPSARISEGIGYFGLTSTISMSLSPMIALWIVDRFGYPVMFTVVSVMVMATLLCGLAISGTRVPLRRPVASITETLANLLERRALLPSLVTFFLSLVNSSMLFFIALYATVLGVHHIGLFFAASSVCMAVSRPMSGRWADRGRTSTVVFVGLLSVAIGVTFVGFSHSIAGFIAAGAVAGLGLGCCIPTLQALAVRHAPPDRRGAATGTFFAAYDMGLGLGAIVWGLVVQASGYRLMFFFALIPLLFAGGIYSRFGRNRAAVNAGAA
jgi:MFS family permease